MQLLLILLLVSSGACQQCFNYSGNQQGCLTSLSACRWVQETNQCMPAILQNMGCFNQLSQASCLNQISNPDGSHAYCLFSGYCRNLSAPVTNCASTLSQAACLSVVGQLCIWSNGCTQVTATQVINYTSASWAYASVGVCQLMTTQPVVHILGAYSVLYSFWLVAKQTSSTLASSYLTQLQIPGCLVATSEMLAQMNCQTIGLNQLSCIQISQAGLYCGFINGSCQNVSSFSTLTCTQALNKNACLAITNYASPCYWDSSCKLFAVDATTTCTDQKYPISVSVCQNIQTQECFYNQTTFQCYQSCRSTYYMSGSLQCATNTACRYNSIISQCQFIGNSQCGILGQNKLSCLNAFEYCKFVNGQCLTVSDINVVNCTDGLNRLACLNVGNINEICQFADNTCSNVLIDSSTRCSELTNVNARTCTKVISEGCYLNLHNCASATGSQVCETVGFNEVACLATTNVVAPCSWSPRTGTCGAITVTKQTTCESLTFVNAVACQNVVYRSNNADQLCKYNSTIYACEVFVMDSTYLCNTAGFNIAACKSVTNTSQACRFGTTGCVTTTAYLGAAVSCSSLQITTSLTCRYVSNGDKCIYSLTSEACTTSVKASVGCTSAGLNSYGCAFQASSCFYYLNNNECASTTGFMNQTTLTKYTTLALCNAAIMPTQICSTILSAITCDMFPSKSACTSITTQGSYCYYNTISNLCYAQTFTTQKTCASFTSANQNLCQAYQVEVAGWVLATTHFCTYTAGACTVYAHATFADCGSSNVINLHACVALSNASMYCYFNTSTLTCTQAMNGATDTVLTTLSCNQGNQSVCTAITTPGQFCQWYSDAIQANKCMVATTTGACASLTKVNANACAAITTNEQCLWNSATQSCNVNAGSLNIPCSTSGINSTLCVASTQQACYFNSTIMQCIQVTASNGAEVDCSSTVNRLGCLASLKSACTWNAGACQKVTGITYTTITCASLTGPYNPIVCASVTTSGQYCAYDSVAFGCVSTPVVVDCQSGYNSNNCQESNSCSLVAYVCSSKPAQSSACTLATTLVACMAVTTIPCMWSSSSCKKINVSPLATCANYSGANSYNSVVCAQIAATGQACQAQSSPYQCVAVAANVNNLPCTSPGLNVNACALNTNQMCMFTSDTMSPDFGCKQLTSAPTQCQTSLSKLACIAATQGVCSFSISAATCSDAVSTASTATCANSADASAFVYTSNYCSYVIGSACKYDSVNFVCQQILTPAATTCSADTSINAIGCNTMINSQTPCTFNLTCQNFTGTLTSCSAAANSRQCTVSTSGQACQWNGTQCINTPSTSVGCASLTLVNQVTCSQQINGVEACQFQDLAPYNNAKCGLPADTAQPCSTLNKQACITNTANGCYYYNQACYDIAVTANAQSALCSSGYSYTPLACALIQTSGQLCQWSVNNCITVTVGSTDTCSHFSSPTYSPNVCAAVSTGACFWNNGCTSTGVVSCLTTKGINPTSCLTATGNCALFNNTCIDVTVLTKQQSLTFSCSYCLNQTACTLVGYNLACQWTGTACQTVQSSTVANCSTYTNVSAGVCQITNDTACTWNSVNQSCVNTSVTSQACSTTGLNLLACATLTTGSCAFVQGYCQSQSPSNTCAIGYNQNACIATTQQCCFWNGNQCNSANIATNATCSINNYSQGCCSQVQNTSCQFSGSCSALAIFTGLCSTVINLYGCQQMLNPCQWINNQCQNQPSKTLGCLSTLSIGACVSQSTFCMFTTQCLTGTVTSCAQLAYSSQSTSQCLLVTDVACNPAAGSPSQGCQILTGSQQCNTPSINSVACLQSLSACQWTTSNNTCGSFNTNNKSCTANVSRGACMQLSCPGCTCQLIQNQCVSYTITTTTLCSNITTSYTGSECRSISTGPCQWDSVNYKCTSVITGSNCTDTSLNQIGCLYVNADCTWATSCQVRPPQTLYTCASILSKFLCLSNQYTSCVWNSTTHICSNYTGGIVTCASHTDLVTSPGVCWYYSSDFCAHNGTKCISAISVNTCVAANSPLSCQAVSGFYCYWDLSNPQLGCQQLPSVSSATSKSCVALKYTSQTICVQPETKGQNCAWSSSKQLCLTLNPYTALCTDPVTQSACRSIVTKGQHCVYKNNACSYSTVSNSCQDIVNIYGCVKITAADQYCQWVGAQCVDISQMNNITQSSVRLINQNVCSKAYLINYNPDMSNMVGVKFDSANFTCQSSDANSDTCATAGLNYFGCLQTLADQCDWRNNYCTTYNDPTVYTTCAEYNTVSPGVCSTISYSGLLCRWSSTTLSCENMSLTNDLCSQSGLNKAGCLAVTTQACTWSNGKCQLQNISIGFTDCLSFTTPINALACASVDLNQQVCKYGSSYCVQSFDPTIDTCSTPGLNRRACSLVQNGNCIFQNGQCQFVQFKTASCGTLTYANANTCASIPSDPCKFDAVIGGCTPITLSDQCSVLGINQSACQQLGCYWYQDLMYCTCSALRSAINLKDCYNLPESACSYPCIWNQICRTKTCSDYDITTCPNATYWKYTCYVSSITNSCQQAAQCGDLKGVSDCSKYSFTAGTCISDQYNPLHCVDNTCANLSQSTCLSTSTCSYASASKLCYSTTCQSLSQASCTGTLNNQQCYWYNGQCYSLNNCQAYGALYSSNTTLAQSQCTNTTINGHACVWQLVAGYTLNYQCGSSQCASYGQAVSNCQGFETTSDVCVLLGTYMCAACSEITDACQCMSYAGYCAYNTQSGCTSVQCSSLDSNTCGMIFEYLGTTARCVLKSNVCSPICAHLTSIQCALRSDCLWNSDISACGLGGSSPVYVNSLSNTVTFTSIGYLIHLMITILFQ